MADFQILNRGKLGQQQDSGSMLSDGIDKSRAAITTNQYQSKMRRKRRDADLLEAVKQIDVHADPAMQAAILEWVSDAYDERGGGRPIGLFSRCYLGHPYCDHRMDLAGSIIEHYTLSEEPPHPYDKARSLAASAAYAFIEVYSDGEVIAVRDDGTV
jgi:hypothetical protein